MKYILQKISVFTILAACITACTKETGTEATPQAVVEAYLMAEQTIIVKISEENTAGSADSLLPIEGLTVYVIHNDIKHQLSYISDGIYSHTSLVVHAGETWKLEFDYNGETVSAETIIPDKPLYFTGSADVITAPSPPTAGVPPTMPDPVTYSWSNPDNDYHLLVVQCLETDPVQISTGATQIGGSNVFRTEPRQGSAEDLRPMQFKYYGLHEVKLYRIWPEYASLYEDTGDNSNNLTAPPGNIVNGLGIFTGVNIADPLTITVQ